MFKAIREALAERKARQLANLKRRGFDYAAGRMLEDGLEARKILKQQVAESKDFGTYNEFDKGIQEAILKFKETLNKEYGKLSTAEELRNAKPGTYVVSGEASAELARQVVRQIERKSFDNSTISERTPNKPHIVFVAGYWRVSTWKRGTGDLYYKAHAFIRRLNNR